MGGVAAAVGKQGQNVAKTVSTMLQVQAHRGSESFGIASSTTVENSKTPENLAEAIKSRIVIGYNSAKPLGKDKPQPLHGRRLGLVFEGRIFPKPDRERSDAEFVLKRLEKDPNVEATRIIKELNGAYAFAVAGESKLIIGRDSLGVYSLYYGENKSLWAAASEQKTLWKIGIENTHAFPPGNTVVVTVEDAIFKQAKILQQAETREITLKNAATILQERLIEAVRARVADTERVAVAFSGGLDSSLVAAAAKKCGVETHLFTVGLEGQTELEHAKHAAALLGLPLHVAVYTERDVASLLPTILWLIEKPSIVDVGVAVPMYWAAENASKMHFDVVLSGQGSDELFGGYHKHLEALQKGGEDKLRDTLFHDVSSCHETNFQRDSKIAAFHKIELRLPFSDWELVNYALSLPPTMKVQPVSGARKLVLREAARNLDLPAIIAERPKKAMQYTTGVDRVLRKLAKKENLTLQNYLLKHFRNAFPRH